MKEEKFFDIVNNVDDELICEMLEYSPDTEKKGGEYEGALYTAPEKPKKVRYWQYPVAMAAFMLLLVGTLFIFNRGNTLPYEQQTSGTTTGTIDPTALSAIDLLHCRIDEEGKYLLDEDILIASDDYDLFRQYFFGTWEGNFCFSHRSEQNSLVIDDSLKSFNMIGLEPWYDGVFYKIEDNVLAFICGGSAGSSVLWLDMNAPETMYVTWGGLGEYNWLCSREDEDGNGMLTNIPALYTLKKTDLPPNEPEDNFLSIFKLRELSRDYGIDFSLLTDMEFDYRDHEDGEIYHLSHNAYALFYPVYFVSETPYWLGFKTIVGNGHDEDVLAEVNYKIGRGDEKWHISEVFLSSIDYTVESNALEILHCHLGDDGEYRVVEGALTVMDDYDLFRQYFFGTWEERTNAQTLIIDDSLKSTIVTERLNNWCFGEYYKIGDNALAFVFGGSGGPVTYWLDMNDPETMYTSLGNIGATGDPKFYYIWTINDEAVPRISWLKKSDAPPNEPEENFLSIFRLREISRDYGIDFSMLVDINLGYWEDDYYYSMSHNGGALSYPIYLVSESADRLEFRTTVGNGFDEGMEAELSFTIEKLDGKWVRTLDTSILEQRPGTLIPEQTEEEEKDPEIYGDNGIITQSVSDLAVTAFLSNDREELSKYLADPSYEALSEGSENIYNKVMHMTWNISDVTEEDGVYSIIYKIVMADSEMFIYLDVGLRKINDEWKVEYIYLQG